LFKKQELVCLFHAGINIMDTGAIMRFIKGSLMAVLVVLVATSAAVAFDRKKEIRNVTGFDGVDIQNTISADVTAGEAYSVEVEADADVLPHILTEVRKGSLHVEFERSWWKKNSRNYKRIKVNVTISLPELNDVDVSGASTVNVRGVNSDRFDIDVSGASVLSIQGNARDVDIDLSGASVLRALDLLTDIAVVDLSGASNVKLSVSTELSVDASGASSINYKGNPRVRKETSGASSVSSN